MTAFAQLWVSVPAEPAQTPLLEAVHRGAVRPDEQRRQEMLAADSNSREQLFSCKGLK